MAYSVSKNALFFQRLKNVAVAARNFLDETERLCDWFDSEIAPAGVDSELLVDAPDLATVAEAKTLLGYVRALKAIHDGLLPDANAALVSHDPILTPFLADQSALSNR